MRIVIDMNLSPKWAGFLQQRGCDAAHWSEIGSPNASDNGILAYAREHGWVVLTSDLDFGAILAATGGNSPSVVQIRADNLRIEAIGTAVATAILQMNEQLDAGALVTVEVTRNRIVSLPIGSNP
jgi:predicted nuclease of predicted toxin-antitoxin system